MSFHDLPNIFTVRNSSGRKVMFSRVSVCPRGRCTPPRQTSPLSRHTPRTDTSLADTPLDRHQQADSPRQTPQQKHTPLGRHPPGRHPPGRHPCLDKHPSGQTPPGRHPPWSNPLPTRTHPTGMHSCIFIFAIIIISSGRSRISQMNSHQPIIWPNYCHNFCLLENKNDINWT